MISNYDSDLKIVDDPLQQQHTMDVSTTTRLEEERDNEENPNSSTSESYQQQQEHLPPKSKQEMIQMLSERYVLQLTPEQDELLDPIERTIRYIVPIPKYYYWDVLKSNIGKEVCDVTTTTTTTTNNDTTSTSTEIDVISTNDIPYSIKSWHSMIYMCDAIGTWTNNYIAQPIASSIGLTGPRFHEVIDSMSEKELQQSKRYVNERKQNDALHRQI